MFEVRKRLELLFFSSELRCATRSYAPRVWHGWWECTALRAMWHEDPWL